MLRWSINLFKVFGIQLELHASFALLLAYAAYEGWVHGRGAGLLWSLLLIVSFFVCVVLHELGHSLTAQRFGVQVPRILLLPIGGMAQLDRIPREPSKELLITIAGPAVNFVLVVVLLPTALRVFFGREYVPEYSMARLFAELCRANLVMGIFNLLPVFPMDGGRIFRAMLATQTSYLNATFWAVRVGRICAVGLAVLMALCFHNYFLSVLFIFIYWAGDMEYRYVLRQEEESRYYDEMARRAREAMRPDPNEPPVPPLLA